MSAKLSQTISAPLGIVDGLGILVNWYHNPTVPIANKKDQRSIQYTKLRDNCVADKTIVLVESLSDCEWSIYGDLLFNFQHKATVASK